MPSLTRTHFKDLYAQRLILEKLASDPDLLEGALHYLDVLDKIKLGQASSYAVIPSFESSAPLPSYEEVNADPWPDPTGIVYEGREVIMKNSHATFAATPHRRYQYLNATWFYVVIVIISPSGGDLLHRCTFADGINTIPNFVLNNKGGLCEYIEDGAAEDGYVCHMKLVSPPNERVEFNVHLSSYAEIAASQEYGLVMKIKYEEGVGLSSSPYGWWEWFVGASEYVDMETAFRWWAILQNASSANFRQKYSPVPGEGSQTEWSVANGKLPTDGLWHIYKVFYKRHTSEGIFRLWIDDELRFDITERKTKDVRDAFYAAMLKLYGVNALPAPLDEQEVWCDYIEIYDGLPT